MNWLDKTLLAVNPRAALKRLQVQHAVQVVEKQLRKYDAAASNRRTSGWRKVSGSANAETDGQAPKLRDRARDLVQNNAWALKALTVIVSNVIGAGILAKPRGADKARVQVAADLWKAWAESPTCDWEGTHDFYGLQALAMQTAVRDGMALLRRRRVPGGPVPIKLQILEADFLDTAARSTNGNRVIQGVEVDGDGRVVAYWFYPNHPGDTGWLGKLSLRGASQRVPAEDVIPLFRKDRAGQLIGVTWFAPVMVPLKDLDDYEDAQLMRQKVAACFAAFVHDSAGADDSVAAGTAVDDLTDKLEPGIIQTLAPGKEITFASPPSVDGSGQFIRDNLRKVAAGLTVTYEALTGDYSQVNFSSGRMGWIEMGRAVERWQWQMIIPQMCGPTWSWFSDAASLTGNNLTGITASWTPPRREMINPKEEVLGKKNEVRSGFTSWSEAVREQGFDPAELIEEMAADAALFDRYGLVLDCDPRRTTNAGLGAVWEASKPPDEEMF